MKMISLLHHSALPAHDRTEILKELLIKVLSQPKGIAAENNH